VIRPAIGALSLVAALLCGLIAMECAPPGTIDQQAYRPGDQQAYRPGDQQAYRPGAQRLPQAPADALAGGSRQVQDWVAAILARPLFEPSRRSPAGAAGSGKMAPGFPRLAGIIITPGSRAAIFSAGGSSRPIVVRAGSRLNGVLIQSIDSGQVVVVDGSGSRILRPSFETKAAGDADAAKTAMPVMVDQPRVPSSQKTAPFASIRGLSGRPLGLAAHPDPLPAPPSGVAADTTSSLPALAPTGGSP
jgi:hypothetical protein